MLDGIKLIVAPHLIPNVFIKNDHRSMGNLFGKKFQNSFGRTVNITINIHGTDRTLVFFNKTGKSFFKPSIVKNYIFLNGWHHTHCAIGAFGLVMPGFGKSFKAIESVYFLVH